MDLLCTRPGCARLNSFPDLDNRNTLQTAPQKFCTSCRMPLILAGRYLPVKLLGQGGFGAAYLALDRFTPTMPFCVVKQFQPSGNLNQQQLDLALSLFEREAVVLEKLGNRHGQIPDLFAYFPLLVDNPRTGRQDQFFYLVQEFINGQDLEKTIEKHGPMQESEVRWVLTEMLNILSFVHGTGAIHRDIKPSNLMRDQEGKLYLLDFGAVKQVTAGVGTGNESSTGIYSMGFAPPEQMTGSQVYPATDLYSLAVTCLYLLTGKTAQDLYDAYHNQWNWRSPGLKVSQSLAEVIDRLLLPTPKDRYSSAEEVLSALDGSKGNKGQSGTVANVSQGSKTQIQPASASSIPTPVAPKTPGKISQAVQNLPVVKVLFQGALTGSAIVFWGIIALSIFPQTNISLGILGMAVALMLLAQFKRLLEVTEMLSLNTLTILALLAIPGLSRWPWILALAAQLDFPVLVTVIVAALAGAIAVVITIALFLLILKLLFAILSKV
ncbi:MULTISPECIES: serine/threonine-protein kinase [unclassified Synechocystis]|uniref:serine/threonine-protein kinase SpkF n=1 Tax=unclassified Synechocystis TaxID=2640012 RepID=UPI00041D9E53|nr:MULTISPECIES: serine/threonine-protein kinase [unclassified Synechocystis]AIE74782.1 serine/threonine kinase [Synechocystis sp. PCC 6714]MCT0253485.1 serine/threonine protein kinase [Synechocystis sp. CS-94]